MTPKKKSKTKNFLKPTKSQKRDNDKGILSGGTIVGIVITCVAVVGAIIALPCLLPCN